MNSASLATSLCEFAPVSSIPSSSPAFSIPYLISPKKPAVSRYSAPTLSAFAEKEIVKKVIAEAITKINFLRLYLLLKIEK